jgi:hypothetical protein
MFYKVFPRATSPLGLHWSKQRMTDAMYFARFSVRRQEVRDRSVVWLGLRAGATDGYVPAKL